MIDYNSILVPMDFSPAARKAARRAGEVSSLIGAKMTLLHVLEHFPEDTPNNVIAPENVDTEQFYVEQARTRLIELRSHLDFDDSTTAMEIIVSTAVDVVASPHSAGRVISEYATQHGMELIVMGTHGRHGLLEAIGSTAGKVLRTASADILVVKP
ncbi:universal stress protein [Thiolapillus sp.]